MDSLHLTRTTSRPATDHPINHTPRPSLPPMTKDPFLLQTIPAPPSPTKSRIADIFHRRRQAARQQQQQQTYPHPPTSMPAALAADPDPIEMRPLAHDHHPAKNTDSTSTSMGTPKSPAPPGAAPLPAPPTTNNGGHRSAPVAGSRHNNNPAAASAAPGYPGSLLEGVRYSAGGEPVGWYEMFEKTRKFEGGFVETKEGGVRCIHPSAWGEDELGEYVTGGGGEQQRAGARASAGGGKGPRGGSGGGMVGEGEGEGEGGPTRPGLLAAQQQQGAGVNRADSETLGSGRFGDVAPVVPTSGRAAALRSGLIGLEGGDCADDGDDEGEGGPSRGGSHQMEMIKVILAEGPDPPPQRRLR